MQRRGQVVNTLHGTLMIAAGLALLAGAVAGVRAARRVNLVVGPLWVAFDLFALATGRSSLNVLAINDHDADLLLVASLALLATGLVLDLPRTSGLGRKYRTVRYGQGPRYVDPDEVAAVANGADRTR